jgi:hypothetical protein
MSPFRRLWIAKAAAYATSSLMNKMMCEEFSKCMNEESSAFRPGDESYLRNIRSYHNDELRLPEKPLQKTRNKPASHIFKRLTKTSCWVPTQTNNGYLSLSSLSRVSLCTAILPLLGNTNAREKYLATAKVLCMPFISKINKIRGEQAKAKRPTAL